MEMPIKECGAKVVTLDMPTIDEKTPFGRMMKTMQYMFASYEVSHMQERVENGINNRLRNGYRAFNKPPLGYIRKKLGRKNYDDTIDE